MIYLDNAATTNKKPRAVYRAVNKTLKKLSANAGRGGYNLSILAAEKIYETRESIASFLNFPFPERVVFTMNATYALNIAIKGLIRDKCHIILSDIEHNSVMRPIHRLHDELGVEYSVFNSSAKSLKEEIEYHIKSDTKGIITTLASNVTGKEIPLEILSAIAKERHLFLIVDASQYIGHKPIDLQKTPCDILCAPAHKALFGIMGLGFLVVSHEIDPKTVIEGGSGSYSKSLYMPDDLPERFEAGTLPLPAICALFEGIRFIKGVGLDSVDKRIALLTKYCSDLILSVPGTMIYSQNLGIVTFNLINYKSEHLSSLLNKHGVSVRGGFHCAPAAHSVLGTSESGAVRISFSYFTKKKDIRALYRALKKISKGCYCT